MNITQVSEIEVKEIMPGFFGRMIHTENNTIAFWDVLVGASLPSHAHVHEQVTKVLEGELKMTVGGITEILKAGQLVVIPSMVEHSAVALTPVKILDVFAPRREDYMI